MLGVTFVAVHSIQFSVLIARVRDRSRSLGNPRESHLFASREWKGDSALNCNLFATVAAVIGKWATN